MLITVQEMTEKEVASGIPFDYKEKLPYSYYIDFANESKKFNLEMLPAIFDKLPHENLYFYMQIHLLMKENIVEYCNKNNIQLHHLQLFRANSYLFARVDINNIENLIKTFPLVDMITPRMGDISFFTPLKNIEINSVESSKGWLFKNLDDSSAVFFVSDPTNCSVTLYSNDEFYRVDSLENNFSEIISEIID
ncbi:hypothetical protein [Kurthia senegalensis]|uniref:hypothetical protein n=1 Tax=Kurthia senegalensis TaxID=1033740 RepID=UPI00028851DA|nr:hypothetical protein [Kurthia senegalensis]